MKKAEDASWLSESKKKASINNFMASGLGAKKMSEKNMNHHAKFVKL